MVVGGPNEREDYHLEAGEVSATNARMSDVRHGRLPNLDFAAWAF